MWLTFYIYSTHGKNKGKKPSFRGTVPSVLGKSVAEFHSPGETASCRPGTGQRAHTYSQSSRQFAQDDWGFAFRDASAIQN